MVSMDIIVAAFVAMTFASVPVCGSVSSMVLGSFDWARLLSGYWAVDLRKLLALVACIVWLVVDRFDLDF